MKRYRGALTAAGVERLQANGGFAHVYAGMDVLFTLTDPARATYQFVADEVYDVRGAFLVRRISFAGEAPGIEPLEPLPWEVNP